MPPLHLGTKQQQLYLLLRFILASIKDSERNKKVDGIATTIKLRTTVSVYDGVTVIFVRVKYYQPSKIVLVDIYVRY